MKRIFLALVLALVTTNALALPPVILGHNGSIMQSNLDPRTGAFPLSKNEILEKH
jgi:hypothetical protein